jgi:hypothetical protein
MKNRLLIIFSLLLVAFASCKKDENRIYFEGGTAPVLSASSTNDLVLTLADKNKDAVTFSWTNPDYRFTTGTSSQDVSYILQVDTAGANFTNPALQEVSISKNLSVTLSVQQLNSILTKLNLAENMPHDLEFRLKSTLGNNSVPLYSNVIALTATPYLDVAVPIPPTGELYITGDATASGWTNNPPATQQFTKVSNTLYQIVVTLGSGAYKFLSTPNQWQPQYGGKSADGGDIGYNMGSSSDPDAIPSQGVGTYKITVNFKTGKYTVVKQ